MTIKFILNGFFWLLKVVFAETTVTLLDPLLYISFLLYTAGFFCLGNQHAYVSVCVCMCVCMCLHVSTSEAINN